MVNRTNHNTAREIDRRTEAEKAILNYQRPPSQKLQFNDSIHSDDLITSLSDAYENRRARQVIEWEQIYWQNLGA
jgi:hypothetical protein